ncbi:MAG TPA: hypothetical protein VJM49_01945, partial [Acidimicrobiales bacterium]|nr:hypothetical protein [Acidimicrobiales bacterium]
AVRRALAGLAPDDKTEPDPVEAVRSQWLNIWPTRLTLAGGEVLVAPEMWMRLRVPDDATPGRLWVAVEDNYGNGAAVAAVADLGDATFEVDGWTCEHRDEAIASAQALIASWSSPVTLLVGSSLSHRRGRVTSPADTRFGLPLVRSLVGQGRIVHDDTPELDEQLADVRVRQMPGGGLSLVPGPRSDLVRAVAWALRAATVPVPQPAIG